MKTMLNYTSGIIICLSIISFINNLDYLYGIDSYATIHYALLPLIVVLFSGFGVTICLNQFSISQASFSYAFAFSSLFLLLQLFLMLLPGLSSCGCVSIKQVLNNYEPNYMFTIASLSFIYHLVLFLIIPVPSTKE